MLGTDLYPTWQAVVLLILVAIYARALFYLVSGVLNKRGQHPAVSIIFMFLGVGIFAYSSMSNIPFMLVYVIFTLFFLLSFGIIFRPSCSDNITLSLSILINIMALRSLSSCIVALYFDMPIFQVEQNEQLHMYTMLLCAVICVIVTHLVLWIFPFQYLQDVLKNEQQKRFLIAWAALIYLYYMQNTKTYNLPILYDTIVIYDQLFSTVICLLSFYYILYYTYRTNFVIALEQKNDEYKAELYNHQQLVENFTQHYRFQFEANLSVDFVESNDHVFSEHMAKTHNRYSLFHALLADDFIHPDCRSDFIASVNTKHLLTAYAQDITVLTFDTRQKNTVFDSEYVWYRYNISIIQDTRTKDIQANFFLENVDEEKKQLSALTQEAQRDALTKLYNKKQTEAFVEQKLANGVGSLFLIDLDNFKTVNDTLGHAKGDEVLMELSQELKSIFRDDDILGRIGGDEFMAFIPNLIDKNTIHHKARQVKNACYKQFMDANGHGFTISSSIGIFISRERGIRFADAYNKADMAMYTTKNKTKNGFTIYSDIALKSK